jgi:hypothetical protein
MGDQGQSRGPEQLLGQRGRTRRSGQPETLPAPEASDREHVVPPEDDNPHADRSRTGARAREAIQVWQGKHGRPL